MLYFYNYSFIKFLNSLRVYLVIIFFINIILLLVAPFICLADVDINPQSEDKEILNSLSEDSLIRQYCERTGMSVSEASYKIKLELEYLDGLSSEELKQYEEFISGKTETSKKILGPIKIVLWILAYGFIGSYFFLHLTTYSMSQSIQKGHPTYKLPFIAKPVMRPIIARAGWLFGIICFLIQNLPSSFC